MIQLNGFKLVVARRLVYKNIESDDKAKPDVFSSYSTAKTTASEIDVDDVFTSI